MPGKYQTFDDQQGASDSPAKLKALRLPALRGKSFLDLGCNEGYFCIYAKQQGATRVVGIDVNPEFIARAKARAPGIDFRCQSWDTLPDETFDVILLASALHYAKDQAELLNRIHACLTDTGMLVLEAGIARESGKRWVETPRKVGSVLYPTRDLMLELLSRYAVKEIGPSVKQSGDPGRRVVFHCRRFRPILVMLTGKPYSGKSVLARELERVGVRTLELDDHIRELKRSDPPTALSSFLRENHDGRRAREFFLHHSSHPMMDSLIEEIAGSLPEGRIVAADGFAFGVPGLKERFLEASRRRGFYVWAAEPLMKGGLNVEDPFALTAETEQPEVTAFTAQVYWAAKGQPFTRSQCVSARAERRPGDQSVSFPLPPLRVEETELRLDLADGPGVMRINSLRFVDRSGRALWEWDGRAKSLARSRAKQVTFLPQQRGSRGAEVRLEGDDPYVTFALDRGVPRGALVEGSVEFGFAWIEEGGLGQTR